MRLYLIFVLLLTGCSSLIDQLDQRLQAQNDIWLRCHGTPWANSEYCS